MREIFKQEIEQLGLDLASMAEQMSTAIGKAVTALEQADLALAEQVIDADEKIDAIQHNIDEQAVSLLARQQPVATDLRVVITALRMSSTLERMGDLARHVADVARGRYPGLAARGPGDVVRMQMGRPAVDVGDPVVRLVNTQDLDLAASIESEDSVLDQLHEESFQVVLDETVELPRQEIVDVVLLGRYLERFGDHGVSIARRISFLVTGDLTNAVATETNGTDVQCPPDPPPTAGRERADDEPGRWMQAIPAATGPATSRARVVAYRPWLATAAMASLAASGSR